MQGNDAGGIVIIVGFIVAAYLWFLVGGVGGLFGWWSSRQAIAAATRATPTRSLAQAHDSRAAAPLDAIERLFANELTPIPVALADLEPEFFTRTMIERAARQFLPEITRPRDWAGEDQDAAKVYADTSENFLQQAAVGAILGATIRRTLREFSDQDRATLKLAYLLETLRVISRRERLLVVVPLVWNEGQCLLTPGGSAFFGADRRTKIHDTIDDIVNSHFGGKSAATERIEGALRSALGASSPLAAEEKSVLQKSLFTGARWLTPEDDYSNLKPNADSPSALRFGRFPGTSRDMFYDLWESVFTVAPPGTGKSQALLIRNLLHNRAGAVVVDVKGELYEATAAWRAANVGPVYRYDPTEPEHSIAFNPLDWIRGDDKVDFAYEDAEALAKLLVFPPEKSDYWEVAGTRALATALAKSALAPGNAGRNVADAVSSLIDVAGAVGGDDASTLDAILAKSDPVVREWMTAMHGIGQPLLYNEARALVTLPPRQRAGVIEVARAQLTTWQSGNTYRISQKSDLRGRDFRGGAGHGPATLYITVPLSRIDTYRTTIRALLGCLFTDLTSGRPDASVMPVTFYIDEMPQLKRLDVFERGLATGRGYGVRFWFFTQTMAQVNDIYQRAAPGLLDMCGARIYMNPAPEDAATISKALNEREGLLDARRKPLVDPADLYGPEFRNDLVVISRANFPARLRKVFPSDDPEVQRRLGAST